MSRVRFRQGPVEWEFRGTERFVERHLARFVAGKPAAAPAPIDPGAAVAAFLKAHPPAPDDPQTGAALSFAYYLQERAGAVSVRLGDLLRCCLRAGVDTRDFRRTLDVLDARGWLEADADGGYRVTPAGRARVEGGGRGLS